MLRTKLKKWATGQLSRTNVETMLKNRIITAKNHKLQETFTQTAFRTTTQISKSLFPRKDKQSLIAQENQKERDKEKLIGKIRDFCQS